MVAPLARVASTLDRGASVGITRVAAIPQYCAAMATACAWLPEENATTPRFRSSEERLKIKFAAPRILNAPPVCRFSHLKNPVSPDALSKLDDVITGVLFTMGAIRTAAS